MYLGVDHLTDWLVGAAIGVTIPLLAFRLLCPGSVFPVRWRRSGRSAHLDVGGARGDAIRHALTHQLGLDVGEIKPFGLAGSAGSTPLRITVEGDPPTHLFGKLYARNHLRSDRWYKLGRELLYGRLEDEKAFNTVRRLVQQEDYALHKLHAAGLPTPRPYGFVELTPEREYLLVTEFFEGATELGEAEVDEGVIDDGLAIVRTLWEAGLAHRDIKPANLLVRDGRVLLIDVAFAQVRPSPWRQAVDLANMMLCLALRSDPEQVYERALRQFSVAEIAEAFAATRGLAMPSQLRRMIRERGRDLHEEFLRLLPGRPRPIAIQRWSLRRVGLVLAVVAAVAILVPSMVSLATSDNRLDVAIGSASRCASLESQWLMAQSVRSASLIPCVRTLPAGVVVGDVKVDSGGATVRFDRLGSEGDPEKAMDARLAGACDVRGSVEVPSDRQGTRRYERREQVAGRPRSARSYVFPGGCLVERFPSGPEGANVADERPLALDLITRDQLRQALDERSDGRLRLDPEGR